MNVQRRSVAKFIGLGALAAIVAVMAVGVSFFATHRTVVTASTDVAEREFAELRQRFVTQQPVLDMTRREASSVAPSQPAASIRTFHTVIYDTRDGHRLVRIDVPFWFARRSARHDGEFRWLGELTFLDDTEFDPEAIRLSLDAIERRGPGLVAYHRHEGGGQFISWVE